MADQSQPFISMVLIGCNEQKNVWGCFNSFWDHVDEVVYVDTGSTDHTVREIQQVARERDGLGKLVLGQFKWRNDFAAARNYAHSLAKGEWHSWADLDDIVQGAENLRDIARNAKPETVAIMVDYSYATDDHGNTVCTLKRERLVRAGCLEWVGRVHEAQKIDGPVEYVGPDKLLWKHRKKAGDKPTSRNLKILEKWAKAEPDNGRVIQYLGTERAGQGQHEKAIEAYEHYLTLPNEPADHRAQAYRKLATSLMALDRKEDAFRVGVEAHAENPLWPDCYLTLAQTGYLLGKHDSVIWWAQEALRRGQPDTLLIINPLDYSFEPRVVMAGSLAALGRLDEACQLSEEALAIAPDHPILSPSYATWREMRKKKKTVETWLLCAQMLVTHDEQQKALDLLERTVPYTATDDFRIVALRSELRERLRLASDVEAYSEHYKDASQPEDMVPDDKVVPLCEHLPRAQFLARQVEEMLEVAA